MEPYNPATDASPKAETKRAEGVTELEATEPMLRFFRYSHLPTDKQEVSKPFCVLAEGLVERLPRNAERTVALRKLLESKDCAVRASIYQ